MVIKLAHIKGFENGSWSFQQHAAVYLLLSVVYWWRICSSCLNLCSYKPAYSLIFSFTHILSLDLKEEFSIIISAVFLYSTYLTFDLVFWTHPIKPHKHSLLTSHHWTSTFSRIPHGMRSQCRTHQRGRQKTHVH